MNLLHIQTNQDLAKELNVGGARFLTSLAYTTRDHYKKYKIPKKTPGEYREIYDPDKTLRRVQYAVLKRVLEKIPASPLTYAFEPGKSVPQMAALHVGKAIVVSYDIKNYFPSIRTPVIKQLLIDEGMGELPAATVAELCTYTFFVPQGALTSPKLSNLIATKTFVPPIEEYCREQGLTLTVYADDITISGSTVPNILTLHETVRDALEIHGFVLHRKKTKIMGKAKRQWVCGVVVNEKTNMLKAERRKLRAIVHNVGLHGVEQEAQKMNLPVEEFKRHIGGRLNWFKQLNPDQGASLALSWKQLLSGDRVENNQVGTTAVPGLLTP